MLVKFYCPEHGYVCMALSTARVRCGAKTGGPKSKRCNQRAIPKEKK